jgi:hypothetical protein
MSFLVSFVLKVVFDGIQLNPFMGKGVTHQQDKLASPSFCQLFTVGRVSALVPRNALPIPFGAEIPMTYGNQKFLACDLPIRRRDELEVAHPDQSVHSLFGLHLATH